MPRSTSRAKFLATVAAATVTVAGVYAFAARRCDGAGDVEQASMALQTFSSGPNFISLRLKSSALINHNVRHLRFELPDPVSYSGLPLDFVPPGRFETARAMAFGHPTAHPC